MLNRFFNFLTPNQKLPKPPASNHPALNNVTLDELAALSNDVYFDNDRPPLPAKWRLYMKSKTSITGYQGAVYIKYDPKPIAIVFANRGTVLLAEDLIADVQILSRINQMQFDDVNRFAGEAEEKMKADPLFDNLQEEDVSFYFTGHSLGAILANFFYTIYFMSSAHCITFENPGSYQILLDYWTKAFGDKASALQHLDGMVANVSCYQADYDMINTCNWQWGNVFKMTKPVYNYEPITIPGLPNNIKYPQPDVVDSPIKNLYYLGAYSCFDQNSMNKMEEYIKAGKSFDQQLPYPVGLSEAYRCYLDPIKRFDYWTGYFNWCWDNYPSEREKYNDNKDNYIAEKFEMLQILHDKKPLSAVNEKSVTNNSIFKHANEKLVPIVHGDTIYDFIMLDSDTDKTERTKLQP